MANEAQAKRWNDDRWAAAWTKRERLTDAVSPYLLETADVATGQRVCDIGCGGGALTIAAADAVAPDGRAVGVDISAPLLRLARGRAEQSGVTNVRFEQMDVQTTPLDEAPFDLVLSQFGVMFFDEPTRAFGAIRSLLTAGGRFVFVCWQGVEHNPWHVGTALRPLLPPPRVPPPGKSPAGPFVLGDDEYVRDLLGAAGFAGVESTPHETTVRAPADAVVDRSLLQFMGVAPQREDEARAVVGRHLAQFAVGPEEYEYPLAFRVYEAVNP
ncbi:MAG: class I SAM-dependent methyltransferase [Acidimicrobiales bacterium]